MTSLILFLINPLLGFLKAIKDLDRRWNGLVFIAFYAIFGYAISFNLTSADSYRIAARFCQQEIDFRSVWGLYRNGQITDVYMLFIYGVIQSFTRNPKVLFGVMGGIMGVFSYLSVKQLFIVWESERDRYFYILVLFFFLAVSFFNVNGIRFWTASAAFSFFVIRYLYFNKRIALLGVLVTPLIHFGYLLAVVGLFVFIILNKLIKKSSVYYITMILAFGMSVLSPQSAIDDLMGADGDTEEMTSSSAIGRKVDNYRNTSDNVKRELESHSSKPQSVYRRANDLFTKTFDYVNKIGMVLMLTILFRRRKGIIQTEVQQRLFCFVLFFFAVGFLASLLMSSGSRYIRIANMMYVFWLLTVFRENVQISAQWKKFVSCLFVLNFYALAFLFYNAPRLVTPMLWFLPPIFTIIDGIGFSPIDFI